MEDHDTSTDAATESISSPSTDNSKLPCLRSGRGAWYYDPGKPLGPAGGFGQVFAGFGPDGSAVAVKLLKVEVEFSGHRELRIAEELKSRAYKYIIPFLDAGVDEQSKRYFVVMARAEQSLAFLLREHGPRSEDRAVQILSDIAAGIEEMDDIVHRDLKPGNVLLHEKFWKLADLGIAKFIADSTSIETLKGCLSPEYAAPEQWRLERCTKSTDIYAFGCIMYAVLNGRAPFSGPAPHDYRKQHLEEEPPELNASESLRQLAAHCLLKLPRSRPTIDSIRSQLRGVHGTIVARKSPLIKAGAEIAARAAKESALQAQRDRAARERRELAEVATEALKTLIESLLGEVESEATLAERTDDSRSLSTAMGVQLGSGHLEFCLCYPVIAEDAFCDSGWDVLAGAVIGVRQNSSSYPGRSANLWYADISKRGSYRWLEVPYMSQPLVPKHRVIEPFGFEHELELREADLAAAPTVAGAQFAAEPVPIDLEFREAFFERWKGRLALASKNELRRPRSLPE